jgi:hypothetical protein
MAVLWEHELAQIMEKEEKLLDEIYKCSKEKSRLLASGDVDEIDKVVSREQTLAMQMQSAEKKRISFLRENRLSAKTLREICEMARSDYKEILQGNLETLCTKIKELKEINKLNNELTKSRLEFYGKLRALYSKSAFGYNKEPN